jgi:YggT family protein
MQNKFVVMILVATNKLTDPLLNPIRKIVPNLGGIDVSPIILVLLLIFIQNNIKYNFLT